MLYTLSKAHYDLDELTQLLAQINKNDAVVLWLDGVLQAVKYPSFFANLNHIYALENDVKARGLQVAINTLSLSEFVILTEQFYPQVAL